MSTKPAPMTPAEAAQLVCAAIERLKTGRDLDSVRVDALNALRPVYAHLALLQAPPVAAPKNARDEVTNIEQHIHMMLPADYLASIGADVDAPSHKRQLHHRCLRIFSDLADRLAQAAPVAETPSLPAADARPTIRYDREGAHATFNGGNHNDCCRKAFHHGMDTVFNLADAGALLPVADARLVELVKKRIAISEAAALDAAAEKNEALMSYHQGCMGMGACLLDDLTPLPATSEPR